MDWGKFAKKLSSRWILHCAVVSQPLQYFDKLHSSCKQCFQAHLYERSKASDKNDKLRCFLWCTCFLLFHMAACEHGVSLRQEGHLLSPINHMRSSGAASVAQGPTSRSILGPGTLPLCLLVQSEDSVLLFVIAWTITEIIRYSFYTFSLLNHLPYLIKWARYTLFIVLYPMGVSGELLTIYAALPFVRQAGLYSISLPNKYNFSFDYYAFLILIMISYIPIFPQLYFHMIHQRRKVLSHTEEHKKFD
ncbi:hypothetical protein GH733_002980 [Mirounga leonina]|nr:hypothetical protein GH733_002980 [Mirounga leonina]